MEEWRGREDREESKRGKVLTNWRGEKRKGRRVREGECGGMEEERGE